MSFAETRLDLGIDYGTRSSLRFSTSIIVDGRGAEQRNANWSQPLGRYQIGDRTVYNTELDYFLDFHAARKGSYQGFRFKDWADYQGTRQLLGTGDGIKKQFQLIKTYTIGSYSVKRPIIKPVGGTVKIYLSSIQIDSGWSIDTATGAITFAAAPTTGTEVAADFEFDVPVRFEQDKIDFRFLAYDPATSDALFQLQNLSLVELRLLPTIPSPQSSIDVEIDEILDLGYDYGTVGGPAYNTTITNIGASYEKRTSNWDESRGRWQIGDRVLTLSELDYFIAFFRNVRGAAVKFSYFDWQSTENKLVRFETDEVEFRFDAIDIVTGEACFYLAGLAVALTVAPMPITFVTPIANNPVYIGFSAATGSYFASHDLLFATANGKIIVGNSDSSSLQLNGNAAMMADNTVRLVPNSGGKAGSVFYKSQINSLLAELNIYFVFKISGTLTRNHVADGIACLITSSLSGTSTLATGGGIGYQGIANTLAIEYDIFLNSWDPNSNHVGVSINGSTTTNPTATPAFDMYGDECHSWIEYDFSNLTLQVYLSPNSEKPSTSLISMALDIGLVLN